MTLPLGLKGTDPPWRDPSTSPHPPTDLLSVKCCQLLGERVSNQLGDRIPLNLPTEPFRPGAAGWGVQGRGVRGTAPVGLLPRSLTCARRTPAVFSVPRSLARSGRPQVVCQKRQNTHGEEAPPGE